MARPWVLPDDEDAIGVREVFDFDGGFSDADRFGEPEAARLVAHVGTVGQVVGAELTREGSVEERRFVAGAAGGIERRLVGRREGAELGANEVERFVPR